jgi:hypothetical protein
MYIANWSFFLGSPLTPKKNKSISCFYLLSPLTYLISPGGENIEMKTITAESTEKQRQVK